jgi:hypothetical protein
MVTLLCERLNDRSVDGRSYARGHRDDRNLRAPNVLGVSCAAGPRVPKPERRGGCRRGVAKPRLANCNRRDAVTLATQ